MSFTSAGIIKALLECFGLDVSWPALVIPVGAAVQSQSRPPPAELDFMESLGTQPLLKAISTWESHIPAAFQSTVTVLAG